MSDQETAEKTKKSRNINISMEMFQEALSAYRMDGRAGDEEVDLMEWAWGYAHRELGGDPQAIADQLEVHWSTLYKVWTGTYAAGLGNLCEKIGILKRRVEDKRVSIFVHTPVTERIWEALDYARDYSAAVLICGPTGSSKTSTVLEWASQNNHGRSIYVSCPSGCSRPRFVQAIAKAMEISVRRKDSMGTEESIKKALNRRRILIIDEAGHVIPDKKHDVDPPLEFARDLHDTTGCAVAIVVTDCYWDAMLHGRQSHVLEQWVGRISHRVIVPRNTVFRDEVEQMIRLYGEVEPTPALYRACVAVTKSNEGRLRTLCEDLRQAAAVAKEEGVPLSAEHLELARQFRTRGGSWDEVQKA